MPATLSVDINQVLTTLGKADGESVSAAELGVSLLSNAVAGTLPNGQRCIETNGVSNLLLRPEALATATARTEDHYAVRFHLRAKTSGAVTPGNYDSFIRNAAAGDPRFHLNYNETHFGAPGRHAAPGIAHQFVAAQTSTAGRAVPLNESVELTWMAHRSGTAATDFVGLFFNGTCVAAGTNMQNQVTFSNANFFQLPIVANITWQIHGTLEVYSVDDYVAEGLLEPPDETYRIYQAVGSTTAFRLPGLSVVQSGITYADIPQNAGSGINVGDHAIELTGSTGSSETVTYRPPVAPSFSDDGHLHIRWSQVQCASSTTMMLRLQDDAGNNVLRVRITDDALAGPSIDYRIGTEAWVTLADAGVAIDNLHIIHVTQRDDGWFSIQVKDDTIVNSADGAVWSTKVYVGHTTPIRQIQTNRTGTYLSSTTTYRGHLEIAHRPVIEVYTNSWTSGDAAGNSGKVVNQVANHITLAMRGSKVGERFSRETLGPVVGSGDLAFRFDGAGAFGRRGWSEADWSAVSPDLPDHIMGAICMTGFSAMNIMDENEATIDAGGAGAAALLASKTAVYLDIISRLLANRNIVWFFGFVTPPVGAFTDRTTSAAKAQFVADLNTGIIAGLRQMVVPAGSKLVFSDVQDYAENVAGEEPAVDWGWDEYGIHLSNASDSTYLEYALSAAELFGPSSTGAGFARRAARIIVDMEDLVE